MTDIVGFNPELDLVLDRVVPTPRHLVWKAWTEPEHLKKWFCPRPWMTVDCAIDLRPGGRFVTRMQGQNGEDAPGEGCYLEIVPQQRLVWTSALAAGFRPNAQPMGDGAFLFTGALTFSDVPGGTRYLVHAMHATAAGRKAHEDMGFAQGWGTALDQLVEAMKAEA
jgi:uncharacterized protein YndB with AHSA1/START domain